MNVQKFVCFLAAAFLFAASPALAGKPAACKDNDGDTFKAYNASTCPTGNDCNDASASIYPGATEICGDGIDQDCSGADLACQTGCVDADGDTYSAFNATTCPTGNDCNDGNPNVNPGAAEICGDGIDQDCSGADLACASNPHATLTWPTNCTSCHEQEARDMYGSVHYQWKAENPENTNVGDGTQQGKITNTINSYCISILGDWKVCGGCHVGKGAMPVDTATPSVDQLANVDCLMCHNAAYAAVRARQADGSMNPPPTTPQATLDGYVQNISLPVRDNCLVCHAKAAGGDSKKRGDISLALAHNTDPNFDVHMNEAGANVKCQQCHVFQNHRTIGRGSDILPTDDVARGSEVKCSTCHATKEAPTGHTTAAVNRHQARVACQSCHIPLYGKDALGTEIARDWRTHHGGIDASTCSSTNPCPAHPETIHQQNIIPQYLFWNRSSEMALYGDDVSGTYDASKGTYTTARPNGGINDGKLYPFKYKTAVQPMTISGSMLVALDTFVYMKGTGNVNEAIASGLVNMGLPSNEPTQWVTTDVYQLINHGVNPATGVAPCTQCHGSMSANLDVATDSMMDKVGYKLKGPKAQICTQCHREKTPRTHEAMHNHINKGSGIDCKWCHNIDRPERGLCSPCDPNCKTEFANGPNPNYPHQCN